MAIIAWENNDGRNDVVRQRNTVETSYHLEGNNIDSETSTLFVNHPCSLNNTNNTITQVLATYFGA